MSAVATGQMPVVETTQFVLHQDGAQLCRNTVDGINKQESDPHSPQLASQPSQRLEWRSLVTPTSITLYSQDRILNYCIE